MKYRNYILGALTGIVSITAVSANKLNAPKEEFDINKVVFIEEDQDWDLGFDTALYLPENFDPYNGKFSLKAINYIDECDKIELGFDTSGYLPVGFDPYIQ
ncbi:hypothetical protein [Flagellimonas sp.]|uniref:hypothetical protein n=1 Tax=Flagellimonas sp. TaxID=2058762 RepID=UPI003B5A9633